MAKVDDDGRTENSKISDKLVRIGCLEQLRELHTSGELSTDERSRVGLLELVKRVTKLERSRSAGELQGGQLLLNLLSLRKDELRPGSEGGHIDEDEKAAKS